MRIDPGLPGRKPDEAESSPWSIENSPGSKLLPSESRTTYSRGQLAFNSRPRCTASPRVSREATRRDSPSLSIANNVYIIPSSESLVPLSPDGVCDVEHNGK